MLCTWPVRGQGAEVLCRVWGELWGWDPWQHRVGGCAVVGPLLSAVRGCPGSQEATARQQTVHPRARPIHLPAQLLPRGWQQAGLRAVSRWGILIRGAGLWGGARQSILPSPGCVWHKDPDTVNGWIPGGMRYGERGLPTSSVRSVPHEVELLLGLCHCPCGLCHHRELWCEGAGFLLQLQIWVVGASTAGLG